MDQDQIEMRLRGKLRETVGHESFTMNCALDLVDQMRVGAAQMIDDDRTSELDFEEAFGHLDKVLAEMDQRRISLGLANFEETTLSAALDGLCPVWPFCRGRG